jgi:HEAT repeat protein
MSIVAQYVERKAYSGMIDNRDIENVSELQQPSYNFSKQGFLSLYAPIILLWVGFILIFPCLFFIFLEPLFAPIFKWTIVFILLLASVLLLYFLLADERRALRHFIDEAHQEQEKYKRIYIALSSNKFAAANDLPASVGPLQEVQEVFGSQNENLLLLGVPGAGKTISLQVHQYDALEPQHKVEMIRGTRKIPIFLPMKEYNDFLNNTFFASPQFEAESFQIDSIEQLPLLSYLATGTLAGTKYIRRYLKKWMRQGRLLLLCDGLNEFNTFYLAFLCTELSYVMRQSDNRIVMTCRELDYNDHQMLQQLVGNGLAHRQILRPLYQDQIKEFVGKYVEAYKTSGDPSKYTTEEIINLIDRTRLRYECTNPLMLATLIEVVNSRVQVTPSQIDTRGRLLHAWVASLIDRELTKDQLQPPPFQRKDVFTLYSQVAYIARRRSKDSRNALPLGTGGTKKKYTLRELANELERLLADPGGPDSTITSQDHIWKEPFPKAVLEKLLEFARRANIITFSSGYLLSFRHELIAEYFVAEYLNTAFEKLNKRELPFGVALIEHVSDWKEPIHNWAGLMDNPTVLADLIAQLGLQNPDYGFNALTLSLLCVGTRLGTVEDQAKRRYGLPAYTKELFKKHVDTPEKQERLAKTIDECAQEGGIGVYRAFLPLLQAPNIDKVILKLNRESVPGVLFEYLREIIEKNAQMQLLPYLISILGNFKSASVPTAIVLSRPLVSGNSVADEKQIRLRRSAIEILGLTGEPAAVEPLITYLNEFSDIRSATEQALIHLGPELVLFTILGRLAHHTLASATAIEQVHNELYALLVILADFLSRVNKRPHDAAYYRSIVTALLPVLTISYVRAQEFTYDLLFQEAQSNTPQREWVIETLIEKMATSDSSLIKKILSDQNTNATPLLLRYLRQLSSETHRERIVEVLGMKHDPAALPDLIEFIVTPLPGLRRQVAKTLIALQPESIPKLIEVVLRENFEEGIEAQKILQEIGQPCIVEVCKSLNPIVPERTQLLVQVLAGNRDTSAIPHLILLLSNALHDEGLAITAIHTLREFSDLRVVAALIDVLNYTYNAVYDEATRALSQIGMIAVTPLVTALDVEQETHATHGIRDALVHIKSDPYPYSQLLQIVEQASKAQEQQLMNVFLARAADAASFLVNRLCSQPERVRTFIRQIVDQISPEDSIPALLHAVDNADCHDEVSSRLYKHRQITIPKLAQQLGDKRYGTSSAEILVDFGPEVIPHLLSSLGGETEQERKLAQQIIAKVARQHPELLPEILLLFRRTSHYPDASRAYNSLISVLIQPLADLSLPYLLEGLASDDRRIRTGVKDALVRLVRLGNEHSTKVQKNLIVSLSIIERRNEAIDVLIHIGDPVISEINELITDANPGVSQAAISILSQLPGALLTIYEDLRNLKLREPALSAFRKMQTRNIITLLINLLTNDDMHKVLAATTLLLQRLIDDVSTPYTDKKMLPALLDYLQLRERSNETMHIVAFLLLLPKELLHLLARDMLFRNPTAHQWLTPFILLLDMRDAETKQLLLERLGNENISVELRAQIMSLLGILDENSNSLAVQWASRINQLAQQGGRIYQENLFVAQGALGGLLLSGRWNLNTLQQLRQQYKPEAFQHELYSILLGESYLPVINGLRNELQNEKAKVEEQKRINTELQTTIATKERELTRLQSENQRVSSQLQHEESHSSGLRLEKRELEQQLQVARQRIQELETFHQPTYPFQHRIP